MKHTMKTLNQLRLEKLHNLADWHVDNTGSELTAAVRTAGYDISPRNLINGWNAWNMTVQDFLSALYASSKTASKC